jgi:hypothetical protein
MEAATIAHRLGMMKPGSCPLVSTPAALRGGGPATMSRQGRRKPSKYHNALEYHMTTIRVTSRPPAAGSAQPGKAGRATRAAPGRRSPDSRTPPQAAAELAEWRCN